MKYFLLLLLFTLCGYAVYLHNQPKRIYVIPYHTPSEDEVLHPVEYEKLDPDCLSVS